MNSSMTFLMYREKGSEADYTKLIDVKDYPDNLRGEREVLDNTTLSSDSYTYEKGIRNPGGGSGYPFTCNYSKAGFLKLIAMEENEYEFSVWFGGTDNGDGTFTPTGSDGKFSFTGSLSVDVGGKGVNEVREMTVTVLPSSAVAFE